MVETGISRRHCRRSGPGDFVHPIAVAKASKFEKSTIGDVEIPAPDNMMPAQNGGTVVESRWVMASEMDLPPTDWPCQRKKSVLCVDMYLL
jgi:hypothetical protein